MSRSFKIFLAATLSLTLLIGGGSANAADSYPKTTDFITNSFNSNSGTVIQLFGSNQWGLSLEALMQRKGAGLSFAKQLRQIRYLLATTSVVTGLSTKPKSGYLYSSEQQLLPGRAGLFLTASAALRVPNAPLRTSVLTALKTTIMKDGSLSLAGAGAIDYAWVILGLHSNGQTALANLVSVAALKQQNEDGGFRSFEQLGSIDATGLMLQALVSVQNLGTSTTMAKRNQALTSAVAFLQANDVNDNHFQTSGTVDVNATAYAAMGIKAAVSTKAATPYILWLRKQVGSDGGLVTPWSNGVGDVFATVQSYLAITSKSYLDTLK